MSILDNPNFPMMDGSKIFYTSYKNALNSGASFTELIGMDEFSGGEIVNEYDEYRTFNNTVVYKRLKCKNFKNISIKTGKIVDDDPGAFYNSASRIIYDLCNKRTRIDLVKCVPIFNSDNFECTIYSGFLISANCDDVMSNTHASGNYEFVVDNVKEAVGTISSSGSLSLIART